MAVNTPQQGGSHTVPAGFPETDVWGEPVTLPRDQNGSWVVRLLDVGGSVYNVYTFGAIGDGASHPLSSKYATLAQAQNDYPQAVSLNEEIDQVAILKALETAGSATSACKRVQIPYGTFLVDLYAHPINAARFVALYVRSGVEVLLDRGATIFLKAGQTHGNDVENVGDYLLFNYTDTAAGGDQDIVIRGGIFDGNSQNQTHTCGGISSNRCRNFQCVETIVQNMRGTATSGVNEAFHFDSIFGERPSWTRCIARNTSTLVANDGVINSTTTFTSQAATFTAADVGKTISYMGSDRLRVTTTIAGFTDAHTITLGAAATNSLSNVRFIYGWATATGFSANSSAEPTWQDCIAYGMTVNVGFTEFNTTGSKTSNCWAGLNCGGGFNTESSGDFLKANCRAGGIATGQATPVSINGMQLGDTGSGGTVSYTASTLTDTSKSWLPNQWAGGEVLLYQVTGATRAMVASNTATVITLKDQFQNGTPAGSTQYQVGAALGNLGTGVSNNGDTNGQIQPGRYMNIISRTNGTSNWIIQKARGSQLMQCDGSDSFWFIGFQFLGCPDSELHGCTGKRNYWNGLRFGISGIDSTGCKVFGGDFSENGISATGGDSQQAGIYLADGSIVKLVGTRATDSKTTKTQTYGLSPQNTSTALAESCDFAGNLTGSVNLAGTPKANAQIRHCQGYNPIGAVTTPGFPATTVAVTNNQGVDVMAYGVNGVNALTIQVDAVAALMVVPANASFSVRIPAGSTFTPTYGGGAPVWKWYGE